MPTDGEEQKHTRVPDGGNGSTRGCRTEALGAEQTRDGAAETRRRRRVQNTTGKRTDHIHGWCARQDPRAHTHMRLPSRANPRCPHTSRCQCNLHSSVTGHHSGVAQPEPRHHQVSLGSGHPPPSR